MSALAGGPGDWESVRVNLHDWIDELCDVLDIDADVDVDEALVLDLARVAAHSVERMAAPVTTYLLGLAAGATDASPEQVEALAARAQVLAEGWDRPAAAREDDGLDDEVPDDSGVDHSQDAFDEEE